MPVRRKVKLRCSDPIRIGHGGTFSRMPQTGLVRLRPKRLDCPMKPQRDAGLRDPVRDDRVLRFRLAEAPLVRPLVIAAMGLGVVLVSPAMASASPPDHGTFSSHEVFVDSEVCAPEGFPVNVVEDEVSTFRVFFDRTGEIAFIAVHVDYRAVISANGHTIVERDRWKDTFYPDGTARTVGNTVHIQGVGPGLVQHDAGQIVFSSDGSVAAIHGPHPQFSARRSALRCCRSDHSDQTGPDGGCRVARTATPAPRAHVSRRPPMRLRCDRSCRAMSAHAEERTLAPLHLGDSGPESAKRTDTSRMSNADRNVSAQSGFTSESVWTFNCTATPRLCGNSSHRLASSSQLDARAL